MTTAPRPVRGARTRTRSAFRRARPVRGGRGFSLLELAIALGLLATVLIALNRFVLGGLTSSAVNIEIADGRRQLAYTRALLAADLAQARACDPTGFGAPLLRFDNISALKRLAVYTDATPDGTTQLVEWRFNTDGTVMRLATTQTGVVCDYTIPPPPESGQTIEYSTASVEAIVTARGVDDVTLAGSLSYITYDGAGNPSVATPDTTKGHDDVCEGWSQGLCYMDTITVTFDLVTAGAETVVTPFVWQLPVNLENARL